MLYYLTLNKGVRQDTIKKKLSDCAVINTYTSNYYRVLVVYAPDSKYPDKVSILAKLKRDDYVEIQDCLVINVEIKYGISNIESICNYMDNLTSKLNIVSRCAPSHSTNGKLTIKLFIRTNNLDEYSNGLKLVEVLKTQDIVDSAKLY